MTELAQNADGLKEADIEMRLDRAARLVPRRRFFSDMPDKGLFALVAVFGFIGILFLKMHQFNADYIAGGAVALMLAYGLIAFQFRRVQLRPDRLGDNFYYLGFIFTLASLSAALLLLRNGNDIKDLLGSFGIALFTTIVGVAGRVLFVQLRADIDEVEDEVRRDLLGASADLRAQLSLTLAEFETFHTGVQQAARKAAEESVGAAQDSVSNISRVANTAAENIDRAFRTEGDRVEVLREGTSKIEVKLVRLANDLNDRFDEFGARLDRVVDRLSVAIGLIEKRRRWFHFWPFHRS
ncbi:MULTISPECIES: hypothetical protein [unclassified Bradyrhizobium]|uniref:hypothetical protein n=1 Tax=unclassified Bradyrhizobium TaxID=2631580 RepID=UPI0028E22983|nr:MULTISPECIES: hypothetical protein [unclassified Bradyrhizobium]